MKQSFRDLYTFDRDCITKGIRFEIMGSGFLLAHAGRSNPDWLVAHERETAPFRKQMELDVLSREDDFKITLGVFTSAILLDWDGVDDEQGNPIPYSKKAAEKLFTEFPELMQDLRAFAANIANYRKNNPEFDAKN